MAGGSSDGVTLKVATWNTEWAPPTSKRGVLIRERLAYDNPDIVCLTECHREFLASWGGYTAVSGPNWGYGRDAEWREVLLWSREPWRDVNTAEQSGLPTGRFVSATTACVVGCVSVAGLVVPYHFAHVRAGRRDRRPWEEHCFFLDAAGQVLNSLPAPLIVLGDFNQRIPSTWVPRAARERLRRAFAELDIVTAGKAEFGGSSAIDHIACDGSFTAGEIGTLSNITGEGRRISDHFGVTCEFIRSRGRS
jgi:endonuclease/exonuclease/phosphatase family metal-dependent hydrolase